MDDVSDDDEDLPVAATLDPRFRQGLQATWVSVGNVEKYDACPNEVCYMKKLINKSCPSCNTMLSEDDMAADWTASFCHRKHLIYACGESFHNCHENNFLKNQTGLHLP